jgi:hypothetical protein
VPRPTRGSAIVEQAPARARHESDVLLDQAGSSNGALDERRVSYALVAAAIGALVDLVQQLEQTDAEHRVGRGLDANLVEPEPDQSIRVGRASHERLDAVRVDADSRGGVPRAIRRERRQRVFAARRLHRGLRAT